MAIGGLTEPFAQQRSKFIAEHPRIPDESSNRRGKIEKSATGRCSKTLLLWSWLGARPKTEIPILALVFKEISYLLITFEDTGEVRRGSPVNMVGCIYAPY